MQLGLISWKSMPLTERVKKKKNKNPSPAEGETFSYAYCCIETDCTFFLVLLGFDLIFRDKKYRWCLNFLVIKNAYSLHTCSCMYAYVYICVLLLATLDVGSDLAWYFLDLRGVTPRISEVMKFNSTFYDLPQVMVWQHTPASRYLHTSSVFQS